MSKIFYGDSHDTPFIKVAAVANDDKKLNRFELHFNHPIRTFFLSKEEALEFGAQIVLSALQLKSAPLEPSSGDQSPPQAS